MEQLLIFLWVIYIINKNFNNNYLGSQKILGYKPHEIVGKYTPTYYHVSEELKNRGKQLENDFGDKIEGFEVLVHVPKLIGIDETRK